MHGEAGDDRAEDRVERLIHLAQARGYFDHHAVNADHRQRHSRRAADEAGEQNNVDARNAGVDQIVGTDRRRESEEPADFLPNDNRFLRARDGTKEG